MPLNMAKTAIPSPTAAHSPLPFVIIGSIVLIAVLLVIVCILANRMQGKSPVAHFFSLQRVFGVTVVATLLALDTLGVLVLTEFSASNLELAGVGVLVGDILIALVFLPLYAMALTAIRRFMRFPSWDYYLLYPFTIANIVVGILVLIRWRSWF